jgi:hypothetical protein
MEFFGKGVVAGSIAVGGAWAAPSWLICKRPPNR